MAAGSPGVGDTSPLGSGSRAPARGDYPGSMGAPSPRSRSNMPRRSTLKPHPPSKPPQPPPVDPLLAQARAQAAAALLPGETQLRGQQAAAGRRQTDYEAVIRGMSDALAHTLQGYGQQVQGIYGQAGAAQAGLAQGFTQGLRQSVDASAGSANAAITAAGGQAQAPPTDALAITLYGLGGYLPGSMLNAQGAAFGAAAAREPATALGSGLQMLVAAHAQGLVTDQQFADRLAALEAQRPGLVQKAYSGLQAAQAKALTPSAALSNTLGYLVDSSGRPILDAGGKVQPVGRGATKYITRYDPASGMTTAVDPTTGKVVWRSRTGTPVVPTPKAPDTFQAADGGEWAIYQDAKGNWVTKQLTPGAGPKAATPVTRYDPQTGLTTAVDPQTGQVLWRQQTGTPLPKTGPSGKPLQHTTVNGRAYAFDPSSGTFYDPATGKPVDPNARGAGKAAKPVSQAVISKTATAISRGKKGWWASQTNPDATLTSSEFASQVKDAGYNSVGDFLKALREAKTDQERQDLEDKAGLQYSYGDPQELYLQAVQAGLPARRAWQMVRKQWPSWGKGFFRPLPGSESSASRATGYVSPFPVEAPIGRVDQGLDYKASFQGPVYAVGSGKVYKVDQPGSSKWGGGGAIYYKLDKPIRINGRTYNEVYVAETGQINAEVGDLLAPGQQIAYTKSGWQESGFARNGRPLAPDVRVNGSTQPTQAGRDFLAFVQAAGHDTQTTRATTPYKEAPSSFRFNTQINTSAKKYRVDPLFIAAVIDQESSWDPNARSDQDALGLMQVLQSTAGAGVNLWDPSANIDAGTKFLAGLIRQYKGNLRLALAGYNAGPGAVEKYGGVPPYAETQRYVRNVLAVYQKYKRQAGR